jgi:hypothetical protein
MTFSVYDFRSLETKPETETKSEVKK